MDDEPASTSPETARARLRGRRLGLGVIIVTAVLFIGSSAWQIVHALFVESSDEVLDSADQRICAVGVHDLEAALDRAASLVVATSSQADPREAVAVFRRGLSPEWNRAESIQRTCTTSSEGTDAWAALERLRFAEEQLTRQSRAEIGPIRRDLAAHLPSDLR